MSQTPREIVFRAIRFENPERVPRQMWILPWAEREYPQYLEQLQRDFRDDIVCAPNVYISSALVKGDPYEIGTYIDEWGCVFENIHFGIIGEVRDPILKKSKTIAVSSNRVS